MAYTTTFTCDLCGTQAIDDQQFLKEVSVVIENPYGARSSSTNVPKASWCKPCLVRMGVIAVGNTHLPANMAPPTPPTLEEVVRAIVQEEIEAARQ
jgi:hypothetical protein